MENLPGNVAQDSKIASRRSSPAEPKSWTLLLVGAMGNIISFRVTRPLVVTLIVGLVTILAFVVFATFSYHAMRTENRELKRDLDKVRAELVAANKAKELALVRLMLLNESPLDRNTPVQISQVGKPPVLPSQDTKDVVSKVVKPIPGPPPVQTAEMPASPEIVLIEKLEIRQEGESDSVRFKFSLKNIDPQGRRIKGYTFVVLKPEKGSQEPLMVSPWTSLKNGRPTLFRRGQYFSIARFKFVSGTFRGVKTIEPFKTATVYVYSETGDLMAEEVYEVDKILRA